MLNITKEIIVKRLSNSFTFVKGQEYYESNRIIELQANQWRTYFIAKIYGSSIYHTRVQFDSNGDIEFTSCTCPAFEKFEGDCKHVVALLLAISHLQGEKTLRSAPTEGNLNNIIEKYRENLTINKTPVQLEINLEKNEYHAKIDLRVGVEQLYIVRDMAEFIANLIHGVPITFGKKFTYSPRVHYFKEEDKRILDFFAILYENFKTDYYSTIFQKKYLTLNALTEERFFELMINKALNLTYKGHVYKNIQITDESLDLPFHLKDEGHDFILDTEVNTGFDPMTNSGKFVLYDHKIYALSQEQLNIILPIYNEIESKEIKQIRIKDSHKDLFASEVLPNLKKHTKLEISEKVKDTIYSPELNATLYLDKIDETVVGNLLFTYGDMEINPLTSKPVKNDSHKILIRDVERERKIRSLLEESEFKREDERLTLEEELVFDFIQVNLPRLQEHCDIYYSESFKKIKLVKPESFSGHVKLNTELDMLEFNFNIEGIDIQELDGLFSALKEKKKYYKLKDDSFLSLESKELEDIVGVFDKLNIETKGRKDGSLKIPKYKTLYLDQLLKEKGITSVKKDTHFQKLVRDINTPDQIDYKIPENLNATLRDYQQFGFKWLKSLSKYGLGGILADEMGLGKTVQIITFLLSEKAEKSQGTSIIIVPTSLVYNWEEEIKRFAPSLKRLIISGTKNERKEQIKTIKSYDIVITSYPLMRRDIDEYDEFTFDHCILDEAQHIKNHKSLNARSVKRIKAKQRFALTGTPMENALSELWSIFDFLMPGYLSSYHEFSEKHEKPIVKDRDTEKLEDLNKRIRPFILRRLKKDVLKELPDKIEQKILVDMTNQQKKVYLAYLQAIKGEITEEINTKGYQKSHIKILAGLTRLRQICCDPALFLEEYKGKSGKLESLSEIVEEAVEGEHRILIFSQFTTMLKKIRKTLERKKIECLYLDGSTPTKDRGELVKDFNNGVGDVFLISLKAGGTGLNLTAADMVIHYDPWWNPAVEDQATDRTHRIGQKNRVQVIKLITKGTIEEKIAQLQEQKKEMIDKVIQKEETLISKLSEEEIMSLFE